MNKSVLNWTQVCQLHCKTQLHKTLNIGWCWEPIYLMGWHHFWELTLGWDNSEMYVLRNLCSDKFWKICCILGTINTHVAVNYYLFDCGYKDICVNYVEKCFTTSCLESNVTKKSLSHIAICLLETTQPSLTFSSKCDWSSKLRRVSYCLYLKSKTRMTCFPVTNALDY
jgi:hypothetical protein